VTSNRAIPPSALRHRNAHLAPAICAEFKAFGETVPPPGLYSVVNRTVARNLIIIAPALLLTALLGTVVARQPFALGGAPPDLPSTAGAEATPQVEARNLVPEFPPGLFTDGGKYRLNDLDGKVVVLLFYDGADPRFAATAPHRKAIVRLFRDRPVAFFGVQAATIDRARADARRLDLPMPVFADTLGVLALRYGAALTPAKSWRVVIINPRGDIRHGEMLPDLIESELQTAHWTYRDQLATVDPKLEPAIDWLESGNYDQAARHISALANGTDPKAAAAARQLLGELRAPALAWKTLADEQVATAPIAAYDFYARAALFLTAPDAAERLAKVMKRLEAQPEVKSELAARAMLDLLAAAVSEDEQIQKHQAVRYCDQIIKAHPSSPAAQSLVAYLDDLGGAKERLLPGGPVPRRRS
jgi:peroxiredoxin